MKRQYVAALVVSLSVASAQPIFRGNKTFRDSRFFKTVGDADAGGVRAGFENDNRALPATNVAIVQQEGARLAHESLINRILARPWQWQEVGPITGNVAEEWTYTGRATTVSGRITALAMLPTCNVLDCRVYVGAAGGGVWIGANAMGQRQNWSPSNNGLPTNAIGSIIFDPTDRSSRRMYVGTGEANGSSDSEAGVGLYRSNDQGANWSLVPGSYPVSVGRAISSIAVDPVNSQHILIGTAVARHGSSSVNGGRWTPPGAPTIGLYESFNGGATFSLIFSKTADTVNPNTTNGADFFRGGISKIRADRTGIASTAPTPFYFSVFAYGLYRYTGPGVFEQVFASAGGGTAGNSSFARTEFALAPNGNRLRIYLGDAGSGPANFYRVDNALVPANTLTNGVANPGWTKLSNSTEGTPGFSSYDFCGGQCSYDMVVESPAGRPDVVWIGGQMQYEEMGGPSNGRSVQRSTDAGVHFADMTRDTDSPPEGLHPDQHAIAFSPENPDIAFLGSDGGLVRTSGQYVDFTADCGNRPGLSMAELATCNQALKAIPTKLYSLNDGLATLQFQSLSLHPIFPKRDIQGGTQDNGTWNFNGFDWLESVGGDGGQSGYNPASPEIRMHSFFSPAHDVNFNGRDPLAWNWVSDPLLGSNESASFYTPLIADPRVAGTWFDGLQHVWRTLDNGGPQLYLEQHCNEFYGDFAVTCGDWEPLGGPAGSNRPGDLVGTTYGTTKGGSYVVALARARSDNNTLWVGTRLGRLFISKNADAPNPASVSFIRIDTSSQPNRFISSISVDPTNANHAFVSFSGYNAYTPATPGHVFEVTFNPATNTATWKDLSYNLGDQPITAVAYDNYIGDLYAATDFGVAQLRPGSLSWIPAANGLPRVAVYGLTIDTINRVLYAATHGRGAWRLDLYN